MYNRFFQTYLFLFIFNMFNREFNLFIDIRYIIITLGLITLFNGIYNKIKQKNIIYMLKDKYFIVLNIFFIFVILSSLNWLNNGLEINSDVFFDSLILTMYNYIFCINIYFNIEHIDISKIVQYINISLIFLFISIVLTYVGVDITTITGNEFRTYTEDPLSPLRIRIAGYAEDANYASLLAIMTICINYLFNYKNKKIIFILGMIVYLMAFSKTTLIVIGIAIILLILEKKLDLNIYKNTTLILCIGMFIIPFAVVLGNIMNVNMSTLSIRFDMWQNAIDLFLKNPIIGSGLTSVRSYFASVEGGWYVQCHNTFLALMSDTGIIPIALLLYMFYKCIEIENKYFNILILFIFSLCSTYDILAYPFIYFIIVLIYNCILNNEKENF